MIRCPGIAPLEWLARGIARLPQSFLLRLASLLAGLSQVFWARRRRVAQANIALVFPELDPPAQGRLLQANLRETLMGGFELLRAWYAPDSRLRDAVVIEGLEHLHAAKAAGQGVLLFTGHFTQTELAAWLLKRATGGVVRGVVRRHNSACVEDMFERARQRIFGATLAKKDVRGMLRALQAGEWVVYSADQDFNYQHAFVPFFGIPAATFTGTAELVRRSGARMLPFWFHRGADGRYHLRIEAEWPGWRDAEPAQSAAIYMQQLERVVREHPEQYLWVHRRFKTRPPGEAPVYHQA